MAGQNDDPLGMPNEETAFERFRKIREELEAMELPELPEDEIEARHQAVARIPKDLPEVPKLEDIRAGAWDLKERRDAAKVQTEKQQLSDQESARSLGVGMLVAYTIIGVPLLGIGIGWVVDKQLHTELYKGLGALVGMTLGVVVAMSQINRNTKSK